MMPRNSFRCACGCSSPAFARAGFCDRVKGRTAPPAGTNLEMAARRERRTCPREGAGPQPAGLGFAGAGCQHRHRCVSTCKASPPARTSLARTLTKGCTPPPSLRSRTASRSPGSPRRGRRSRPGDRAASELRGAISPPRGARTVREPLGSCGSQCSAFNSNVLSVRYRCRARFRRMPRRAGMDEARRRSGASVLPTSVRQPCLGAR